MSFLRFFRPNHCGLSFELFPPKNDEGIEALKDVLDELVQFTPDFFTCTYGAGGSTQSRTMQVASMVRERYSLPVATHLTCVGSTREQLREYLTNARNAGIDYVVALRGDPPKGETTFKPVDGGLRYANELVELIRKDFGDMGIAVAGYPEVHQEAADRPTDLANLKRKVDAGADIVVTQLFYNNDDFFRFRDDCERNGIDCPIIPGILPVTSLSQIERIASMCKASLPSHFRDRLALNDDSQWQFDVGVEHAVTQVQKLVDQNVPGIHFYVLNKSKATALVLQSAGLRQVS